MFLMTETERLSRDHENASETSQPRLVDVRDLAKILNVPVSWLYDRTRLGTIPCVRLGRYVRFDPDEVIAFFRRQGADGRAQDNRV